MQSSVGSYLSTTKAEAGRIQMDSQSSSFPQFRRLPAELRALIWECTWSGPRVIEVAMHEVDDEKMSESSRSPAADTTKEVDSDVDMSDWSDNSCFEIAYLRPTSRLSVWLEHDFACRLVCDAPFEECPNAAALSVCRESRMLFLERHKLMQHPMLPSAAFYLNPRSDVLCLPNEIEPEHLQEVQKYYGAQLECIHMILVEELGQWEDTPTLATLLPVFKGLGAVKVLLESYEFGGGDSPATEAEYWENAAFLEERDLQLMGGQGWMVQYIDREQNVYATFGG